jgi:hypothetical protein
MTTPDEYDRRALGLDFLAVFAAAALRGELAELELGCPALSAALGAVQDALGLPDGYGLAELDQCVAGLREGLLRGGGG